VIAAIRVSSTPWGKAEAIGKPSTDTIAAALTSGIAVNNFLRIVSKDSGVDSIARSYSQINLG
ncbi:unnamed protein product, partial [marine sediment metagenome]